MKVFSHLRIHLNQENFSSTKLNPRTSTWKLTTILKMNSKDLEYLLDNYIRSKGNLRSYEILKLALEADFIYNFMKQHNVDPV